MDIVVPRQVKDEGVIAYLVELARHKADAEKICTDYSQLEFVEPFATLLMAVGLRDLVSYRRQNGLQMTSKGHKSDREGLSYLRHIGFFHFVGLSGGKLPNEALGGPNYLPITTLTESQFDQNGMRLQDAINRESFRLAQIIYAGNENIMRAEMLAYCLREVVRNVFEHAETSECHLIAQKWANGFAEIAIADQGVGLTESLSMAYEIDAPDIAITKALEPGVTSDTSPESDDEWQNSGFGLYVISQLGAMLGEFAIASDNRIMFTINGNLVWYHVPMQGTAIKLRINTNEAEYWPNVLQNIVGEGEERAKSIPGSKRSASKRSKLSR